MIVSIHQPNFMPWVGFFRKIKMSDNFVILDNVKCSKNSYFNRNRFSTSKNFESFFWLTCPLKKEAYKKMIFEVNCETRFVKKHLNYLQMRHGKTKEVDFLNKIISVYTSFSRTKQAKLIDLNIALINLTCKHLQINTSITRAKNLKPKIESKKQNLVIDIVKSLNGSVYLSGTGAKSYQKNEDFVRENIRLVYTNNNLGSLLPKIQSENVSMVDLMLHLGIEKCKKMILV